MENKVKTMIKFSFFLKINEKGLALYIYWIVKAI